MNSIVYFEYRRSAGRRFPSWIQAELRAKKAYFFYIVDDLSVNEAEGGRLDFVEEQLSVFFGLNYFRRRLEQIRPDVLMVFAHRAPDQYVLSQARKAGIRTLYFQHGMYIPFMKREFRYLVRSVKKSCIYVYFFFLLSLSHKKFSFIGSILAGFLGKKSKYILADQGLVYGEYWIEYHSVNYGYSDEDLFVVGAPDLDKKLSSLTCRFCYVGQTLVEDGRLDRKEFQSFLVRLSQKVRNASERLYVKRHPRTDNTLFEVCLCDVVFVEELPKSDLYIGHYSTLLCQCVSAGTNIVTVEFEGHPVPRCFKDISTGLFSDDLDGLNLLSYASTGEAAGLEGSPSYYFYKNPVGVYKAVAKRCCES